ncbi:MAG: Cyclic-di-AMP phosphodiesterase PgpH [Syntrophomonadaceae bacterium]|nr:Cyclic-di-AMP phosphodiesterase PgpH [Candidatus Psychracetigena formicireducens]MBT9137569.1 Cyclic-di-AMP phosphodiesterase PgpH [Bacillota bacterium]
MGKVNISKNPIYVFFISLIKPTILIVTWLLFIFLFTTPQIRFLNVGDVSKTTIVSPLTAQFIDQVKTEELKKKAEEIVLPVYSNNPIITLNILANLNTSLEFISQVRGQTVNQEEKITFIVGDIGVLSREDALYLLELSDENFKNFSSICTQLLKQLLEAGIKEEKVNQITDLVINSPTLATFTPQEVDIASKLISYQVNEPNSLVDLIATEQKREEARSSVANITGMVYRGETILKEGEVVSLLHLDILEAVGLYRRNLFQYFNPFYFFPYIALLAFGYLKLFSQKQVLGGNTLNDWIWIGATFLVLIISYIYRGLPVEYHFFPMLTVGILIGAATNIAGSAIFIFFSLGIFVLIFPLKGLEAIILLVGIAPALIYMQKVRHRAEYILLSGITFSVLFLLYLPIKLYEGFSLVASLDYSFKLAASSAVAFILAMILLPFFERYLKVLTPFRLLELADLDQFTLKKLFQEAPGTYHHSQLVATLSEHAAGKIKANSLLCKVGGLYHDLGKINHPLFYNENQTGGQSIHQKISPSLSARVIISHPREGAVVGKKVKLPPQIIDIINSHHGTYLVPYFFQEASLKETYPKEETYRYPGPKPNSKEKVIVMLADACEATVRSLTEVNPTRIKETVETIVKERANDGQFSESVISFRELNLVQESLIDDLLTQYHSRVDYGKA